jgi:replication factor A1
VEIHQKIIRAHPLPLGMNVEQVFSQLEGKIVREEFLERIKEKIDEFGGLLSEEGAALIVAADLGVDLRLEQPRQFLQIRDLSIGMGDIWLCARVICVSSIKVFQRDTGTGKVANVEVMDQTGSTRVVLWDDLADFTLNLSKGDIIEVRGGYVKKGFREGVEIQLSPSRRGTICKKSETDKDLPECRTDYTTIQDLVEEIADVDVVGRVGQLFGIREFQRNGGTGKVASLLLVDDTGEIRLCLWNDKADIAMQLKRGDIIAVEDGYTKAGLNGLELHSGWRGRIILHPDVALKKLPEVERISLIDLEQGRSCNVYGTVSDIGENRSFVKSDGSPGQLASFTLQDKTAEIRIVLWNEKANIIDNLVPGIPVSIDNGFAKEGMNGLELHVSSLGQVIVEEEFVPQQKIFSLERGPVAIVGRYYNGTLIDESGRIEIAADKEFGNGQLIRIEGTYDEKIIPETIEEITEEFPSLESLLHPSRKVLSELEEGEYVEIYALVKKVLEFEGYKRITIDDGSGEVAGIIFGDVSEGEEYCFYARIHKRETGTECVCYQYHVAEPEKEALNVIKELEGLMEV